MTPAQLSRQVTLLWLCVASTALAETSHFVDTTGNHLWSDGDNWSDGIPEGPIEPGDQHAFLSEDHGASGRYAVIDYAAPSFWAARLGQVGPNARLVLADAGSLTLGYMIVGATEHAGSVFDMQGGALTCEAGFIVSHVDDPGGVAYLRGGTVTTERLAIGERGRLDVRGGTMRIAGDVSARLADHVDEGRIVAFGGTLGAVVEIDYSGGTGLTSLSARRGPADPLGCVEAPGRPLVLALMGDPQMHMRETTSADVTTAMSDLATIEHDALVVLGDLVHNRAEYYDDYRRLILDRSDVPVYSIAGNADRNAGLEAHEEATGRPLNYVIRERGVRMIFLSVVGTTGDGNHICQMGPEQLAWLEAELGADTTSTTLVFFHAPMFETTWRSGDRSDEPPPQSLYLAESAQVGALFAAHPNVRFYASAHIHTYDLGEVDDEGRGGYAMDDGVLHTIVPTTANNKGSRVLYLSRDEVLVRVRDHATGRWLDEHEYIDRRGTSLQPEVPRSCDGVGEQRDACAGGCDERIRHCDPLVCLWSEWSSCSPCVPDPERDTGVDPPDADAAGPGSDAFPGDAVDAPRDSGPPGDSDSPRDSDSAHDSNRVDGSDSSGDSDPLGDSGLGELPDGIDIDRGGSADPALDSLDRQSDAACVCGVSPVGARDLLGWLALLSTLAPQCVRARRRRGGGA